VRTCEDYQMIFLVPFLDCKKGPWIKINVPVQKVEFDSMVNRFLHPMRMVISGPTACGKVYFWPTHLNLN
jgi:hypothetical protein